MMTFDQAESASAQLFEALSVRDLAPLWVGIGVGLTDADDRARVAVRVPTAEAVEPVLKKVGEIVTDPNDIDLRVVSPPTAKLPKAEERLLAKELAIGMAVHHRDFGAGTLGFFAQRNNDRGFVSCNHVIARMGDFKIGDVILGANENDVVGELVKVVSLRGPGLKVADCAFAKVADGRFPQQPGSLGADGSLGRVENVFLKKTLRVVKQGQTSHRREGTIVAAKMFLALPFYTFTAVFKDVLEIASDEASGGKFGQPGDSGSLVYTKDAINGFKRPVGLLIATRLPKKGPLLAYANPIEGVLSELDAEMVV